MADRRYLRADQPSVPDEGRRDFVVPMNDLKRRWAPLHAEIGAITAEFVEGGRAILGPQVEAFEREFARYCGAVHCVGVGSGTDAIEIALRAIGICRGAKVATVANAGGYSTIAIRAIGAVPQYVDIDQASFNISPFALEQILPVERVDAVIVTHLYGRMAEVEKIDALCKQWNVPWIEDCAQAHGAERLSRRAGAWADAAAFSFYPTKNLGALGDAGAVVTNRPDVAAAARELRQYGWTSKYQAERAGGRNSRLDELQAAYLRKLLPMLDEWNRRRRDIASRYLSGLAGTGVVLPAAAFDDSVWHLFTIRVLEREAVRDALSKHGVASDVHYPTPDYRQPGTASSIRLPATETACASVVSLPLFPELTDGEIDTVIAAVKAVATK